MFEGLHQGRILCSAVADDATLLTGGESTVRSLAQTRGGPLINLMDSRLNTYRLLMRVLLTASDQAFLHSRRIAFSK